MKTLQVAPSLVEQVHKAILAEIAGGRLRPGARIIQEQLAQELGVSHWNLRDWKKRYGPPAPIRSSEVVATELRALRRENERLRAQCDILKKTLGILVEPSPNASRA